MVDADLRLLAPWTGRGKGSVDVRQATWSRRYDVASELLAARTRLEERASLEEGVRYDVKVRVPGTLRIDNNLATLQARADLTLQGSSEEPVVLGRAEIERGRVYFQGNTYVIRRGTLDFANPQKIDRCSTSRRDAHPLLPRDPEDQRDAGARVPHARVGPALERGADPQPAGGRRRERRGQPGHVADPAGQPRGHGAATLAAAA